MYTKLSAKAIIDEMALDLDTNELDNPFDSEFHSAMVGSGQEVVFYYPTTVRKFWDVVNGGIHGAVFKETSDHFDNTIFTSHWDAGAKGRYGPDAGADRAIIFVVEIPYAPQVASRRRRFRSLMPSYATVDRVVPLHITPKHITGVWDIRGREIPIQKFIRKVENGSIEGIEPEAAPPEKGKRRFKTATMDDWQLDAYRLVQAILNYSSGLFDYLIGPEQGVLARKFLGATANMTLSDVNDWRGEDWIKFVEKITGRKDKGEWDEEEEGAPYHEQWRDDRHGFNKPFWQARKKYRNYDGYEWRGHKVPKDRQF